LSAIFFDVSPYIEKAEKYIYAYSDSKGNLITTESTGTSYSFKNVPNAEICTVSAIACQDKKYSASEAVTTATKPYAITSATMVHSAKGAEISWEKVAKCEGYLVYGYSAGNDKYTKLAKVGMALHNDFKLATVNIPRNVFYEKEFWAYLSLTHFKDVVKGLRASLKEGQISADKIKQFYFNAGTLSRTGLLFIWVMIDRLNSADNFDISHTAFEFVDPVKAILERTMSKNPMVLRAFVQGIINNGKDAKFKGKAFKSKMPSHISCYASVSVLDALEYDELVEVITEQQKAIISE
jgi:hypothetical protein